MLKKIISLVFVCVCIAILIPVVASQFGRRLCKKPGYVCVTVKRNQTWKKMFPDATERDVVKRVNRMNTRLRRGMVIAVPKNLQRISHMDIAPLPYRIEPKGQSVLIINLRVHAFGAYDTDGYLLHWGPVSGGRGWCPDVHRRCGTPSGQFYVYSKGSSRCVSKKYPIGKGGAPMAFCMFFYKGYAMHASFLPGYHASHGCVRMFYADAQWLNQHFIRLGRNGTKVIVKR